jgi:hypothetical protein
MAGLVNRLNWDHLSPEGEDGLADSNASPVNLLGAPLSSGRTPWELAGVSGGLDVVGRGGLRKLGDPNDGLDQATGNEGLGGSNEPVFVPI